MNAFTFTITLTLLVFTAMGQAGPLDTWMLGTPSLTDKPLYGIAYGSHQFVAVVWDGTVLTSADGVNWVQRQTGATNFLYGIAYGNGQFVAVGDEGTIATSADGTNWVQRPSVSTIALGSVFYSVFYLHGQFVILGGSGGLGSILTSADGTSWVQQYLGKWDHLDRIAYGNGRFVAVGYNDNGILGPIPTIVETSADGTNWVHVQALSTNGLSGIAFGNGRFVAVGGSYAGSTATIETSPDGVNWVERPPGTTNRLAAIGYGNGQFVAVGGWQDDATGLELSGTIVTSADGVNWVERPSGTTNLLFATAYGNGHFVAVGDNGTILESGSISTVALTPNTSSGLLSLSLEARTGLAYTVQSSTDLMSWQTVTNITPVQSTTVIFDARPSGSDHVFYRAYSR